MISVSEFAPVGTPAEQALQYPYERPPYSYLTNGSEVLRVPETYQEFYDAVDEHLVAAGAPGMDERIPVIAYGANASPYKLRDKMAEYATEGTAVAAEMQIVPNLHVEIPGVAIAWHDRPGQGGSVFAELYKGAETEHSTAEAFIQFMTKEQLAALHASEGLTYHFRPVNTYAEGDTVPRAAYAYIAGISGILLKEDGTPALLSDMTAKEAVQFMLDHTGVSVSAERFVQQTPAELKDKKRRQNLIGGILTAIGLSKSFVYIGSNSDELPQYVGRASLTPNEAMADGKVLVHMMEMDVERLRPDVELRGEKGDIAVKLRDRARQELRQDHGLRLRPKPDK